MLMLLLFLFGLLFTVVAATTLAVNHLAPGLTATITAGWVPAVTGISRSHGWLAAAALAIPAAVFGLFRRHLRARRQAWVLLAIVLLLSLCVAGINAAFSYIGNYFTNALVNKNQDLAYLFVAVYFCGFLTGIPTVAMRG